MILNAVFPLPSFAVTMVVMEAIRAFQAPKKAKWSVEHDEEVDRLRAELHTAKRNASYTVLIENGEVIVAFNGARRSLLAGCEIFHLLPADPCPWDNPGCSAAFTVRGEGHEVTLWGEVEDSSSTSAEALF